MHEEKWFLIQFQIQKNVQEYLENMDFRKFILKFPTMIAS